MTTIGTSHKQLSDGEFDLADQIVREAACAMITQFSGDLPGHQQVCTSSCLSVMLQSTAMMMAEIDQDATSKILTMLGLQLGGDAVNIPAYSDAMRHQQQRLMNSELSLRAQADVRGRA